MREGCWLRQGLSGTRARMQEVRCWTRKEGWGGTAKPLSGRLASQEGFGPLPQDAGMKEKRGSPLENSLSCSGKRTSWEPGGDDPSRLGPQVETGFKSPIASTSGSLKLPSPWQPPPPSCIRGAERHFRCRPSLGRRASCACAEIGGLYRRADAMDSPALCFGVFLLLLGAGSLTFSASDALSLSGLGALATPWMVAVKHARGVRINLGGKALIQMRSQ